MLWLSSDVNMDVVRETFPEGGAELMYTDLAAEDEDALRALMEDRQVHNDRTGGAADG